MNKLDNIIKRLIKEATGDITGSRGSYIPPMQPGIRPFSGESLQPFTTSVSDFKSPLVQYDSYDGKFDLRLDQIKKLEKAASKIQDYIKHHPYSTFSDEDGNPINPEMKDGFNPNIKEKMQPFSEKVPFNEWFEVNDNIINEITTSVTAGEYNGPQELGIRDWTDSELSGFSIKVDDQFNKDSTIKYTKGNIKKTIGGWEPRDKNGFDIPTYDVPSEKEIRVQSNGEIITDPIEWFKKFKNKSNKQVKTKRQIKEDLAVWFGKKKKSKGSSQPKGPWVNICRKVDGKHPPCGRPDTSKGAYPKCRAAGVAGKMSDSQKKSACQQKRQAEKKDTQTGKGQKPIMTSYKPKEK